MHYIPDSTIQQQIYDCLYLIVEYIFIFYYSCLIERLLYLNNFSFLKTFLGAQRAIIIRYLLLSSLKFLSNAF